jgi:hypothetical protein
MRHEKPGQQERGSSSLCFLTESNDFILGIAVRNRPPPDLIIFSKTSGDGITFSQSRAKRKPLKTRCSRARSILCLMWKLKTCSLRGSLSQNFSSSRNHFELNDSFTHSGVTAYFAMCIAQYHFTVLRNSFATRWVIFVSDAISPPMALIRYFNN